MWEIVGERTGSQWSVDVEVGGIDGEDKPQNADVPDSGLRRLKFSISRL
jgi:hypothetical protein